MDTVSLNGSLAAQNICGGDTLYIKNMPTQTFEFHQGNSLLMKKLTEYAQLPSYGSEGAIALDMYAELQTDSRHWRIIYPQERALIPTGIAMAIPNGYYGRIAPRSGLALKSGIDVLGGVIDSDYRGEVKVILINTGNTSFEVRHGDRIAQIIMERADRLKVLLVDQLDGTTRGANGYGSTGI